MNLLVREQVKSRFFHNSWRVMQAYMLLLLAGCTVTARNTASNTSDAGAELIITLGTTNEVITMAQMKRSLTKAKIAVNDPVYQKIKHFEGFWLKDILRLARIELTEGSVLVFSSLDGYQARLVWPPGTGAKPLIAVRDLDREDDWEPFTKGKENTTPAPYYLVWQAPWRAAQLTNRFDVSLPWPYQINHIDVRSIIESKRRLLPMGAETRLDVQRGFDLFYKSCIPCHSINLEGGALGPELNVPKNITEYRNWGYLVDFIKDPSSFRAKSKMPSFKNSLTDQHIDDVLQYLWWMRERKVVP